VTEIMHDDRCKLCSDHE